MRAPAILAGAVLVVSAATPSGAADRLPDWAAAVAAAAATSAPPSPDDTARVLYLEWRVAADRDGTFRVRRRRVVQALGPGAGEVAIGWLPLRGETKVLSCRAWHLAPGGSAQRSRGDAVELAISDSFLTDQRTRFVPVAGIRSGSIVAFEFETLEAPEILSWRTDVVDLAPISRARIEAVAPPGWTIRHAWLRGAPAETVPVAGGVAWEIRDIPAIEEESLGPDPRETAPSLVLRFAPPQGERAGAPSPATWADLATWFRRLSEGRDAVTDAVRAFAASKRPPDGADLFARIGVDARLVRDRVRYVSRQIGIGGYQPYPAEQTAAELHGDCKAKTFLACAVLASDGLRAHPVLVNLTQRGTVAREVPDLLAFDHMIAAVEIPQEADVPPAFAGAIAPGGPTGRLLLVDTTAESVPVGSLPAALGGKTALLIAEGADGLIEIPEPQAGSHTVAWTVEVRRTALGAYDVVETRSALGEPAAEARSQWSASAEDARKRREDDALRRRPKAKLGAVTVVAENEVGGFEERLAYTIPSGAAGSAIAALDVASGEIPRAPLRNRIRAVDYRYPRRITVEAVLRDRPASAPIPQTRRASGAGWSVGASFERDGADLHGRAEIVLERRVFEPESFGELRKLWEAVAAVASTEIAPP